MHRPADAQDDAGDRLRACRGLVRSIMHCTDSYYAERCLADPRPLGASLRIMKRSILPTLAVLTTLVVSPCSAQVYDYSKAGSVVRFSNAPSIICGSEELARRQHYEQD